MGNAESEHLNNSDGEDEAYNYHQTVLKEGSSPVKGSRQEHLPDTPDSSNDGFVDASEEMVSDEEQSPDNDTKSGSFTGSDVSYTGSSQSGSHDKSSVSHSSHSTDRSHDISHSSPSSSKSDQSMNGSGASSGSLPNRIRVIDTSESECEEEAVPVTSSTNPRKQLDFSDKSNENKGHHKNLPRPIPIHKPASVSSQRESSTRDEEIPGRHQQKKRKADDMDSESEEFEAHMAVPVKKTGGTNRPFARRRELRDMVLGRQMSAEAGSGTSTTSNSDVSAETASGTSSSQMSAEANPGISDRSVSVEVTPGTSNGMTSVPEEMQTSDETYNGASQKMDETGDTNVSLKKAKEESQIKFDHSNNSPFKNFHLQPSTSSAGADLSATAQTPKGKTEDTGASPQTSQTVWIGTKRPNSDPDPSTSRIDQEEGGSGTSAYGLGRLDQPSVSGLGNSSRPEHSPRVMPFRGNTGGSSSGSPVGAQSERASGNAGKNAQQNRDRTYGQNHWTAALPKVNVAAAEKRYEGMSVSRHSPAPSTSDWQNTLLRHKGDRFSFMLADILNVHICYDDVTSLRTDALVNPTDGQLTHVNEIARSIAMATGPQMTNQCQFYLRQNGGSLETTEVIETYACGSLSGRVGHVIHLATPIYEAANEKGSVEKLLRSYMNCLNHINENLGLVSVVFPCIGAGSYPQDTCINVFFESLLVHLSERKSSRIKTVKFVVSDVHLGNLAIAMVQAHLERGILEGIDVLMAEALNSYYGNSKWECNQNDLNDQIGRQLEVDSPKKLFRGPPVKRPRL